MSMDKLFDGSDAHLLPEVELKQLIEDAAKLLGLSMFKWNSAINAMQCYSLQDGYFGGVFNPLDPERGDLWKVAMAAELRVDYQTSTVTLPVRAANDLATMLTFTRSDYQSQALAVLRAASAVLNLEENEKCANQL